jgi:hypothetical protein
MEQNNVSTLTNQPRSLAAARGLGAQLGVPRLLESQLAVARLLGGQLGVGGRPVELHGRQHWSLVQVALAGQALAGQALVVELQAFEDFLPTTAAEAA